MAEHVDRGVPCVPLFVERMTRWLPWILELLKKLLDQSAVLAVLDAADHAPHGFGDGTGTALEGWPERAIAFLEKLS